MIVADISNSTLNVLLRELGEECQSVVGYLHQLQSPHLSEQQKAEILSELLTSTIHLSTHCNEELQNLIAEEMERLDDSDKSD
ncbi:MAG: hypothetical protein F6K30_09765 [Cyanothece sp. SIO2G6]|nr:hypothetical protein [Cyanothece sp. SIO2G6]